MTLSYRNDVTIIIEIIYNNELKFLVSLNKISPISSKLEANWARISLYELLNFSCFLDFLFDGLFFLIHISFHCFTIVPYVGREHVEFEFQCVRHTVHRSRIHLQTPDRRAGGSVHPFNHIPAEDVSRRTHVKISKGVRLGTVCRFSHE